MADLYEKYNIFYQKNFAYIILFIKKYALIAKTRAYLLYKVTGKLQ